MKKNENFVLYYAKRTKPQIFQTRFPNIDRHNGGKWLINDTKHHKENQLQSLNPL